MGKVIVIYHSQQYGHTREIAEALADGPARPGLTLLYRHQ